MATYSFKERFVPMLIDHSKTQTVRAYRKDGKIPVAGEALHLFFGMRTKFCKRLNAKGADNVKSVQTIFIFESGIVFLCEPVSKALAFHYLQRPIGVMMPNNPVFCGSVLSIAGKNSFAWKDGFRPENSTSDEPGEAFALMIRFWKLTNEMPFTGTVTYW